MGWIERELVPRATPHREGCDVTLPWEHNKTNDDGDGKENGKKLIADITWSCGDTKFLFNTRREISYQSSGHMFYQEPVLIISPGHNHNWMMTSPKFSTWRPNQGTRSRVTFQLFATPRNDLFPWYPRSCAFDEEAHECEKNGNR